MKPPTLDGNVDADVSKGCHSLALDLLRSWSFERPFFPPPKPRLSKMPTPLGTPGIDGLPSKPPPLDRIPSSPFTSRTRRPSFMLSAGGRRESMFMDMDVLAESEPVSRNASPPSTSPFAPIHEQEQSKVIEGLPNGKPGGQDTEPVHKVAEQQVEPEPPKKIGNLMKELKQDVRQGAMEFSMDSFDF